MHTLFLYKNVMWGLIYLFIIDYNYKFKYNFDIGESYEICKF